MTELDTAIFSTFNTTNSLNTALDGRLYPGAGPDMVDFPYATYNEISGYRDRTFEEEFDEAQIQLSLYSESDSPVEVNTLYGYAHSLFNEALLSVSGWDTVWCKEVDRVRIRDIEQATWAYHVTFEVLLER